MKICVPTCKNPYNPRVGTLKNRPEKVWKKVEKQGAEVDQKRGKNGPQNRHRKNGPTETLRGLILGTKIDPRGPPNRQEGRKTQFWANTIWSQILEAYLCNFGMIFSLVLFPRQK
jgi:hypothetical protein